MPRSIGRRAVRLALGVCLAIALVAAASGCTKPSRYTERNVEEFDDDTTYRITETDTGFRILVNYDEYQWWPSRGRSHQVCRDRLILIAERHAKEVGRKIVEIEENLIRVDSGRNILTGVTTCTAACKVKWRTPAG